MALQGGRATAQRLIKLRFAILGWQGRSLKSELEPWRPLGWIVLAFAAGLLLYLVMPLAHQITGKMPISFWECLKFNLKAQETWLLTMRRFLTEDYRYISLALGSLAPLLFISVRWKFASAQDAASRWFLHIGHLAVAAVCGWILLDGNFSPRRLLPGIPLLANYFFCALALGYCVRYLLATLTSQAIVLRSRQKSGPKYLRYRIKKMLRRATLGLIIFFSLALVTLLALRNEPEIRLTNTTLPDDFARRTVDKFSPGPKVIMSDDHQLLALARLQMLGKSNACDTLFLDTAAAVWFDYHRSQASHYPAVWARAFTESSQHGQMPVLYLEQLIEALGTDRKLCCLHQSPGMILERHDLIPEGMGTVLERNHSDSYLEPRLEPQTIRESEIAWADFDREMLPTFTNYWSATEAQATKHVYNFFSRPLARNQSVQFFANYYSRASDFWGVELQKLGRWPEAAEQFQRAIQLNEKNTAAKINLAFNQQFQSGNTGDRHRAEGFDPYRNREQAEAFCGPLDEPNFCMEAGLAFINAKLGRQAICEFDRAATLAPHNLDAALSLAALYASAGKTELCLKFIQHIRNNALGYGVQPAHEAGLDVIEARAYLNEGRTNAATAALNNAVKVANTDHQVVAGAVHMLLQAGLSTEAISLLNRIIEQPPVNPDILELRRTVLMRLERFSKAD